MTIAQAATSPIRKVNIRQDLLSVADLIEICFAQTLDEDGREYLRQLRWTARDMNYLSWLQGAAERIAPPLYGLVWEENGRIIGNLSLIPLNHNGKLIYLIANVAVHPDFRRQGIGPCLPRKRWNTCASGESKRPGCRCGMIIQSRITCTWRWVSLSARGARPG